MDIKYCLKKINENSFPLLSKNKIYLVGLIIFLAVALRSFGLFYGLPFNLIGDESHSISTALRLISGKTIIANFYTQYPLLMAYINTVLFIPIIFIKLLTNGFNLQRIQIDYIINPSIYYLIARMVNLFFGLTTLLIIYKTSEMIFKKEHPLAKYFPPLLLGISLLHIQMSIQTRMWVPATFFIALFFYYFTKYKLDSKTQSLVGAFASIMIGMGVNGVSIVFLATLPLKKLFFDKVSLRLSLIKYGSVVLGMLCWLCSLGTIKHFFMLFQTDNMLNGISTNAHEFPLNKLVYYFNGVLQYDIHLLILGLLGFIILFASKSPWFKALVLPTVLYFVFIVVMYHQEYRYILPIYVFLCLASGACIALIAKQTREDYRQLLSFAVSFVLIFQLSIVFQFVKIVSQQDSRVLLNQWLGMNIQSGAQIAIYRNGYTPFQTKESYARYISTGKRESRYTSIPNFSDYLPNPKYNLFIMNDSTFKEKIKQFHSKYFIFTYYSNSERSKIPPNYFESRLIWKNYPAGNGSDIPSVLTSNLEPWKTLWHIERGGPNIEVYLLRL